MNDSMFTYKDDVEGKIGIGKLPNDLLPILNEISNEYYKIIPDKRSSTFHSWYEELSLHLKNKVEQIQKHTFFHNLCDKSKKCININASEMDELYYSNPQNNLNKVNLYGSSGNYDIHKDCIFNFDGIKFYRVIIGLTNGNDNVTTYFKHFDVGHKINFGEYVVFDFDKTTHQVFKDKQISTPRILLKLHYIVCENCKYSKQYVERIKRMYLYYEFITRYFMQVGTDPTTLYQFFWGLFCQYYMNKYTKYFIVSFIILMFVLIKFSFKKIGILKVFSIISSSLISLFLFIVLFYWLRYKLFRIK